MTVQNIFGNTPPVSIDTGTDADVINLGFVFKSAVNGNVLGVRWYQGTHDAAFVGREGDLWDINGNLLGSVTMPTPLVADELTWMETFFSSPIPITAETPYVVSVFCNQGNWSATFNGLDADVISGDLTAYSFANDPASIGQGRYNDSAGVVAFPDSASGGHSSYGVDLMFEATPPVIPPTTNDDNLYNRRIWDFWNIA